MTSQRPFMHADIPVFEGRHVHGTTARTSGQWPVDEVADMLLRIGDTVNAIVTLRCIGVAHVLDKQDRLVRVHQLKPTTLTVSAFDPADVLASPVPRIAPRVQLSRTEPESR